MKVIVHCSLVSASKVLYQDIVFSSEETREQKIALLFLQTEKWNLQTKLAGPHGDKETAFNTMMWTELDDWQNAAIQSVCFQYGSLCKVWRVQDTQLWSNSLQETLWRLQGVCLERPPRKVSFVKAFNNTEEEVDEKCACGGQKKNNEKGRRQ